MPTLSEALATASSYWEAKGPSSRMMAIRANACASALSLTTPIAKLDKTHGAKVLTHLRSERSKRTGKPLSKGSIQSYYVAFKRAVEIAGGNCRDWPRSDTPPRRCREPLSEVNIDRLAGALEGYSASYRTCPAAIKEYGYVVILEPPAGVSGEAGGTYVCRTGGNWQTWDLLELLRGTGLRVDVEALSWDALDWNPESRTLKVTGKGGHERIIPVERTGTIALLNSPARMKAMRKLSYSGHLKRWQKATEALRITSLKPTPHAVRHYYATRAYLRSGRNLKVVQELLGHADIGTTARYLGVDMEDMRQAVSEGGDK